MDFFKKKDPRIAELDKKIAVASKTINNYLDDAKVKTHDITTNSEDSIRTIKLANSFIDAVKEYKNSVQQKMSILNESNTPNVKAIEKTVDQVRQANNLLNEVRGQYGEYSTDASALAGMKLPDINEAFGGRKRKTRKLKKFRSRKNKKTRKH
jgi:hypothetical protein